MILNRCTCEETQAATGTHGPCSFCHAGGGEGAPVTAPLDRLWERYRSLGAAQPADFEAFLVAEVERLTKVLTALVDDSEGQQHRLAWQDACEVVYGHRGPEVG